MAKSAIQKITLNQAENIAFDKLFLSQKNVRRIKNGVSIDDLAADIARRGLIQSLNVRPELKDGEETGRYEVPAGGRRFSALQFLVKRKEMAKSAPTPCIVNRSGQTSMEDDSLAENIHRENLHPLDQFRAFKTLSEQGLDVEEIAARYFVSPKADEPITDHPTDETTPEGEGAELPAYLAGDTDPSTDGETAADGKDTDHLQAAE